MPPCWWYELSFSCVINKTDSTLFRVTGAWQAYWAFLRGWLRKNFIDLHSPQQYSSGTIHSLLLEAFQFSLINISVQQYFAFGFFASIFCLYSIRACAHKKGKLIKNWIKQLFQGLKKFWSLAECFLFINKGQPLFFVFGHRHNTET